MSFYKNKLISSAIAFLLGISMVCVFSLRQQQSPSYANILDLSLDNPLPIGKEALRNNKQGEFPLLKGLVFDPKNPANIQFFIDKSDFLKTNQVQIIRQVNYFLGFLAVPKNKLWVNLSPQEKDRIIPEVLNQTDIGKALLLEDYLLKQLTATITDPKTKLGKKFWLKLTKEIKNIEKNKTALIDSFSKIWIVPDKAVLGEYLDKKSGKKVVYIKEAKLKVMLERDYLAYKDDLNNKKLKDKVDQRANQLFKSIVVPVIEDKINKSLNFSGLRQLYCAFILADYLRRNLPKDSFYKNYLDKERIDPLKKWGISTKDKIYQAYLKSIKEGGYNYLLKDYDQIKNKIVQRRFFSGGIMLDAAEARGRFFMPEIVSNYNLSVLEGKELIEGGILEENPFKREMLSDYSGQVNLLAIKEIKDSYQGDLNDLQVRDREKVQACWNIGYIYYQLARDIEVNSVEDISNKLNNYLAAINYYFLAGQNSRLEKRFLANQIMISIYKEIISLLNQVNDKELIVVNEYNPEGKTIKYTINDMYSAIKIVQERLNKIKKESTPIVEKQELPLLMGIDQQRQSEISKVELTRNHKQNIDLYEGLKIEVGFELIPGFLLGINYYNGKIFLKNLRDGPDIDISIDDLKEGVIIGRGEQIQPGFKTKAGRIYTIISNKALLKISRNHILLRFIESSDKSYIEVENIGINKLTLSYKDQQEKEPLVEFSQEKPIDKAKITNSGILRSLSENERITENLSKEELEIRGEFQQMLSSKGADLYLDEGIITLEELAQLKLLPRYKMEWQNDDKGNKDIFYISSFFRDVGGRPTCVIYLNHNTKEGDNKTFVRYCGFSNSHAIWRMYSAYGQILGKGFREDDVDLPIELQNRIMQYYNNQQKPIMDYSNNPIVSKLLKYSGANIPNEEFAGTMRYSPVIPDHGYMGMTPAEQLGGPKDIFILRPIKVTQDYYSYNEIYLRKLQEGKFIDIDQRTDGIYVTCKKMKNFNFDKLEYSFDQMRRNLNLDGFFMEKCQDLYYDFFYNPQSIANAQADIDPDYSKAVAFNQGNNDIYGTVTSYLIPSKNNKYLYLFNVAQDGKYVWLPIIQTNNRYNDPNDPQGLNKKLTRFGVKADQLLFRYPFDQMLMCPYDYTEHITRIPQRYRNKKITNHPKYKQYSLAQDYIDQLTIIANFRKEVLKQDTTKNVGGIDFSLESENAYSLDLSSEDIPKQGGLIYKISTIVKVNNAKQLEEIINTKNELIF